MVSRVDLPVVSTSSTTSTRSPDAEARSRGAGPACRRCARRRWRARRARGPPPGRSRCRPGPATAPRWRPSRASCVGDAGAQRLGPRGVLQDERALQITGAVQPGRQAEMALEQRARFPEQAAERRSRSWGGSISKRTGSASRGRRTFVSISAETGRTLPRVEPSIPVADCGAWAGSAAGPRRQRSCSTGQRGSLPAIQAQSSGDAAHARDSTFGSRHGTGGGPGGPVRFRSGNCSRADTTASAARRPSGASASPTRCSWRWSRTPTSKWCASRRRSRT